MALYSKDELKIIEQIDLVDVAKALGFTVIRQGKNFGVKEISSLKIFPESNTYKRFSSGQGGNPINFCQDFANLTFREAVEYLQKLEGINFIRELNKDRIQNEKVIEDRKLVLTKRNKDMKRVYAYLINTRKISKEVIDENVKNGSIREDFHHNVMFIGRDNDNIPRYCSICGTLSNVKYKGELTNSDKRYGFKIINNSRKVIVCESPIDILSIKTILKSKNVDNNYSYISLGGLSTMTLETFLKENEIGKNVTNIICMLDNDLKGYEAFETIKGTFGKNYEIQNASSQFSRYKDVNEWLQKRGLSNIHFKTDNGDYGVERLQLDVEEEIIKDTDRYIDFLKVLGKNYNISYTNNFSIFSTYPEATNTFSKEYWRKNFNRELIKNAKGIEIIYEEKNINIYDIKETRPVGEDKFKNYFSSKNRNKKVIDLFFKNNFENEKEDISLNEKLIQILEKELKENTKSLYYTKYKDFFIESSMIAISSRLNLDYSPKKDLIEKHIKTEDRAKINILGEEIQKFNKKFLEKFSEELKKELTKGIEDSIINKRQENLIKQNNNDFVLDEFSKKLTEERENVESGRNLDRFSRSSEDFRTEEERKSRDDRGGRTGISLGRFGEGIYGEGKNATWDRNRGTRGRGGDGIYTEGDRRNENSYNSSNQDEKREIPFTERPQTSSKTDNLRLGFNGNGEGEGNLRVKDGYERDSLGEAEVPMFRGQVRVDGGDGTLSRPTISSFTDSTRNGRRYVPKTTESNNNEQRNDWSDKREYAGGRDRKNNLYGQDKYTKLDKENVRIRELEGKIALKVGYEFILTDTKVLEKNNILLKDDERKIYIENEEYKLFSGLTFEESQKIDNLIDSGNFKIYKLNDYVIKKEKNVGQIDQKEEVLSENTSFFVEENLDVVDKIKERYKIGSLVSYENKDYKVLDFGEVGKITKFLILKSEKEEKKVFFTKNTKINDFFENVKLKEEKAKLFSEEREENIKEDLTFVDLKVEEYFKGLEVFLEGEKYIIEENEIDEDSLSILKLQNEFGGKTSVFYTLDSPIENLQVKKESLEKFLKNSNLEKENKLIEEKNDNFGQIDQNEKEQLILDFSLEKNNEIFENTLDRNNINEFSIENKNIELVDIVDNFSEEQEKHKLNIKNFVISEEIQADKLTPSERLNNNIEAISILKRLEKGERELDLTAQEFLAKYVGWGGLSDVFDEDKKGQWEVARNFLKENLTSKEYENAKESTLTAFYTPKIVIDSVYKVLENLGFDGGNILEPSLGIGNFIGNVPKSLKGSNFYGVELDSISGKIAKYLYPESNIKVQGFETTDFSNNFFDVAIGNVPFGNFKISDKVYDKEKFLIHDYFFAKSIDKVRAGGIIAFITSSGTMDKKDNSIRKYISKRCDFLGAIRLPDRTFKGVAGTEVTSDIIFLKKRSNILEKDQEFLFLETDKKGLKYNKYFVDNPEMVLGEMKLESSKFGEKLVCSLPEEDFSKNLKEKIEKVILNIKGEYEKVELDFENEKEKIKTIPADDNVKNFSYTIIDNNIYYRENSIMIEKDFKEKDKEKIKEYLEINESLKHLINLQKENFEDEKIEKEQKNLNFIYDKFVKKYGILNSRSNNLLFREDSNYPLISSLEVIEENKFQRKADIFTKRTIKPKNKVMEVETEKDALFLSISEKGKVDLDYISSLLNKKSKVEIVENLKGEIFLNIRNFDKENNLFPFIKKQKEEDFSFNYVTADEYLSGNIKGKLNVLNEYLEYFSEVLTMMPDNEKEKISEIKEEISNIKFQKEQLEVVLPKKLTANEISLTLGSTWIPEKYINDFIYEILEPSNFYKDSIKVKFFNFNASWKIEGKNLGRNDLSTLTYGTQRANAYTLIENALNFRETKIYDVIEDDLGNKKSILNKNETILAGEKTDLLKMEFKNWIYKDPERRYTLEEIYNDKFNSIRNRVYKGDVLSFEGINESIILKEHQKNAIARTLFGGNTLLAHVVGAGKTFEMVASAMEHKRLGLCNKPLFVVPNHLTEQIGREFMQLYPTANIMIATKKDFETKNRKRFIGKIATGEYDAVIIGHTQFEKIPMSLEYQENFLKKELNTILEYIREYKNDKEQRATVKELEKSKKSIESKLKSLYESDKKDDVINFEELGVDKIYVDEAHSFKNLSIYTKMTNVAGIGNTEAKKSQDMFMKCRYLDELTNGKGIVFATGTPVSNSMTELYTMQRYLQYEELEKKGHHHFDAWASTFGETVSAMELAPEGNKYRIKTRFSKFHNLPELLKIFSEVADIKTKEMLDLPTPEVSFETILTKPTEEQKEILKILSDRADDVRDKRVEPEIDNMLKITNDGKKLALDQRLIDFNLKDDENSKVNTCISKVFEIWQETKDKKSAQLIFCDMSTPKYDGNFNIYDDIKDKLIKKGIPESEIAFIHDANNEKQKDELFSKVRKGDIRVFLGSTSKCGAGTNMQDKLIAMHDLDVPWRPSDLEQRAGRIVRRGNENEKVKIFRYITEDTFDSYLFQILENKQKFISQIMTSKTPARSMEDIDDTTLSYAEIKALATANPYIKEKMDLETEITKLKMLESNFNSNKFSLEDKILKVYPQKLKKLEEEKEFVLKDIELYEEVKKIYNFKNINLDENTTKDKEENFNYFKLNGEVFENKKIAGEKLIETLKNVRLNEKKEIGEYKGFKITSTYDFRVRSYIFYLNGNGEYQGFFGTSPEGNFTRMDNILEKLPLEKTKLEEKIDLVKKDLEIAKKEKEKTFPKEKELKDKVLRLSEINRLLDIEGVKEFSMKENVEEIKELEKEVFEILLKNMEYDTAEVELNEMKSKKVYEFCIEKEDRTFKCIFDINNLQSKIIDDDIFEVLEERSYKRIDEDISNSSPIIQMKNEINMIDLTINDFLKREKKLDNDFNSSNTVKVM